MRKSLGELWLALLLTACATVPYTHRKQLLMFGESEEVSLGLKSFEEIKKTEKISHNPEYNAIIQRVGANISRAADKKDYEWEFIVIDASATVNAFALPGGKVAFYTGIMPICKDDNGVAVVMGHEVAHALARHGGERMSQGLLAQLGEMGVAIAVGDQSPQAQQGILTGYGVLVGVGALLPFSRKQESEADQIGLILTAKAGYDPKYAVDFWRRMANLSQGGKPMEFPSTHPSDERRIQQIEAWLPEAYSYYKK